jgi:hypothetical protein
MSAIASAPLHDAMAGMGSLTDFETSSKDRTAPPAASPSS